MGNSLDSVKVGTVTNKEHDEVSKKTLDKVWFTWFKYCLGVFGFERLEGPGFSMSMIPLFRELYKDKPEKQIEAVKRHNVFFNTHPYLGGLIVGIVTSMEIEKANGGDISDEMVDNLKVGMMGPVAGIGDSLFQATLYPIVFAVAIGLSAGGSPIGAILTVLSVFFLQLFTTRYTFYQGLKLGQNAFEVLLGESMAKIQNSLAVLGLTVMGAITAQFVHFDLTIKYTSSVNEVDVQTILDSIFPNILPIALVMLGFYLLRKKNISAIKLILVYVVIVTISAVLGIV